MKLLKVIGYTVWILLSIALALVMFPLSILLICTIILSPVGLLMFVGTCGMISAPFLTLRKKEPKCQTLIVAKSVS